MALLSCYNCCILQGHIFNYLDAISVRGVCVCVCAFLALGIVSCVLVLSSLLLLLLLLHDCHTDVSCH